MKLNKKWSVKVLSSVLGATALGSVIAVTASSCDSIQAPGSSVDAVSNVATGNEAGAGGPTGAADNRTLQQALGADVKANAFDAKLTGAEAKGTTARQQLMQNTWIFAGGSDTYADWSTMKAQKSFVQVFDENVRYQTADFTDANAALSTTTRFVIDKSAPGQSLKSLTADFNAKIGQYAPKNVVYVVDEADISDANFAGTLTDFAKKVLALRANTSTLTIVKHWKTGTTLDGQFATLSKAVDEAIQSLFANADTKSLVTRINPVDASVLTKPAAGVYSQQLAQFQNDLAKLIYDTASGHYAGTADSTLEPASAYDYLKDNKPSDFVSVTVPQTVNTNAMEWADRDYTGNGMDLVNVVRSQSSGKPATPSDFTSAEARNLWQWPYMFHDLTITLPHPETMTGKTVTVYLDYPNVNYHMRQKLTVGANGQVKLEKVPYWYLSTGDTYNGFTTRSTYDITVVDNTTDQAYNTWRYVPDGSDPTQASTTVRNAAAKQLTSAQSGFMSKFNGKTPMNWVFMGTTPDTGFGAYRQTDNYGFTNYAQTVERAVKSTAPNRVNDTFVDATMVGDFLGRASDADLIQARVGTYNPDVIVLSYGLTERISDLTYPNLSPEKVNTFAGASSNESDDQVMQNIGKLVDTLSAKFPNAYILLNDVDASANSQNGNRRISLDSYVATVQAKHPKVLYSTSTDDVFNTMFQQYGWRANDGVDYRDGQILGVNAALQKAEGLFDAMGISGGYNTYLADYRINDFGVRTSGSYDGGRWNFATDPYSLTGNTTPPTDAPHDNIDLSRFRKTWYVYSPQMDNIAKTLKGNNYDPGQIRVELTDGDRAMAFQSNYGVFGYDLFTLNVGQQAAKTNIGFGYDMFVAPGTNYKVSSVTALPKAEAQSAGGYYITNMNLPSNPYIQQAPIAKT